MFMERRLVKIGVAAEMLETKLDTLRKRERTDELLPTRKTRGGTRYQALGRLSQGAEGGQGGAIRRLPEVSVGQALRLSLSSGQRRGDGQNGRQARETPLRGLGSDARTSSLRRRGSERVRIRVRGALVRRAHLRHSRQPAGARRRGNQSGDNAGDAPGQLKKRAMPEFCQHRPFGLPFVRSPRS